MYTYAYIRIYTSTYVYQGLVGVFMHFACEYSEDCLQETLGKLIRLTTMH